MKAFIVIFTFCLCNCLLWSTKALDSPDTRPTGYWNIANGNTWSAIPSGYQALPSGMTPYELYQLQIYCVSQINTLRSGSMPFSNGQTSSDVPVNSIPMLNTPDLQCNNARALSDLVKINSSGQCNNYAFNAGDTCGFNSGLGTENSCCNYYSCTTLDSCKQTFDACLSTCWNEGIYADGTWASAPAYYNMIDSTIGAVTCGFAWNANNQVTILLDFYDPSPKTACNYSCPGGSCGSCWSGILPTTSVPTTTSRPTTTLAPTTSAPANSSASGSGASSSSSVDLVSTDGTSTSLQVAIYVLVAVIVILIVVFGVLYWRHRRSQSPKPEAADMAKGGDANIIKMDEIPVSLTSAGPSIPPPRPPIVRSARPHLIPARPNAC